MSEIEDWMVPQSERQISERRDNELLSAIRAALEAAIRKANEISKRLHRKGDTHKMYGANQVLHALMNISPDDILKGMK